jgi:hypothetical protein
MKLVAFSVQSACLNRLSIFLGRVRAKHLRLEPGDTMGVEFPALRALDLLNAPDRGATISAMAGMTVAIEPVSAAIRTILLKTLCNSPRKRNFAPGDCPRMRPP